MTRYLVFWFEILWDVEEFVFKFRFDMAEHSNKHILGAVVRHKFVINSFMLEREFLVWFVEQFMSG